MDPHRIFVNKSGWAAGPWKSEPDRVQWTTAVGLPAVLIRNRRGAWCGYAAVPPGHPCYEVGHAELPMQVHGGLNYSNHCQAHGPICHVPAPGEPDEVWWVGFDCGHTWDLCPRDLVDDPRPRKGVRYRDLDFAQGEVEKLAAQLADYPASTGQEQAPFARAAAADM